MKLVVAVSGGVDSVALLHRLVAIGEHELVVAHFDHGIRRESTDDALFVGELAEQYGLPFFTKREVLGPDASEELARERRYAFLRDVKREVSAQSIATAHHADDIVETICINLYRGTGWRGLAVLDGPDMYRPLLGWRKKEVVAYTKEHGLAWREDSTNASTKYLRNRFRQKLARLDDDTVRQLCALRYAQVECRQNIETEVEWLWPEAERYSRYWLTYMPEPEALEGLRHLTLGRLTRPQLERLLLAIKTMPPGKVYQAGAGVDVHFSTRYFSL